MPSAPSWLLNSGSQTSHSAPKTPTIKKEPGTEESPRVLAQVEPTPKSAKRKARSESPSDSDRSNDGKSKKKRTERRNKFKTSEVWQYLVSVSSDTLDEPYGSLTKTRYMRNIVALPRKRELPAVWATRLASEKPSSEVLQLLIAYLVGDDPGGFLCGLNGPDCAGKWRITGPAMATFLDDKEAIHKACAFPKCVFCPELEDSNSTSGKRKCCNTVYRDSDDPSMPEVWLPPTPAPAPDPVPTPVSTPVHTPAPTSTVNPTPTPAPSAQAATALPASLNPETPSHQLHHEAQAQEGNVYLASLWEQRNEAMYLSGPLNVSTSYAHSAGWLHQREGQVLPIGADSGATLQILDLENKGATVPLPSDSHNLLCIVFEGTVEVILQDTPVFTLSRGGQWSVGVGKECRVRNPRIGTKAILYNIGAPVRQNDE
ncbi:uncharacterized protein B0T23DRAFT_433611 [Neurospora hispaniola]|uniref:Uncharacterized protein n=1 Tax=Neurospora hispaniola TaxID=588809 RepID=A0AAJ0IEL7_9PEZI|nr:hypothetical protein B0T23DRAFT_433611 [Neurospora hispaniola]